MSKPIVTDAIANVETVNPHLGAPAGGDFLGHPKGLYVLFLTEMWERFSFYGMRALLVLYMTNYLIDAHASGLYVFGFGTLRALFESAGSPLQNQQLSSIIYGWYTGLVYLTPLFGGMLADRILGQRKTVFIGGILMAIGHFLMAVESLFLPALFFLIIGNGCFKPNISTQVGSLYAPGDNRRDSAFTIFYMGINIGAFASSIICGWLGEKIGWHWGFGAAGVGMVLGVLVYAFGQRYLAPDQKMKDEATHTEAKALTKAEWRAIAGLFVLCVLNIIFWVVYEQQGNTMQVFANRSVDWTIFGWEMPSTWFQAFNPMFIFLLSPLMIGFWTKQRNKNREPGSIGKMAIGSAILGGSFLILMYSTTGITDATKISFLWLVATTFVYTFGELYFSPIGLSLVTKVAPARYVGALMGMWFMSSAIGNLLSGYVGMLYSVMSMDSFFLVLAALGAASGLAIFALKRPLQKAIGGNL